MAYPVAKFPMNLKTRSVNRKYLSNYLTNVHLHTTINIMKKKKMKIKYKVTNKNIAMRFKAEQERNPDFTLVEMARFFGVIDAHGEPQKPVVWRWVQTKNYKRLPNFTYKCPHCGKTQSDRVFDWINDGTLN